MALHRARTCFTAPGVPADPELSWPQEEAVLSAGQPLWIAGLLSTCCPHLALFAANLWILLRSRLLCFLVCTLASVHASDRKRSLKVWPPTPIRGPRRLFIKSLLWPFKGHSELSFRTLPASPLLDCRGTGMPEREDRKMASQYQKPAEHASHWHCSRPRRLRGVKKISGCLSPHRLL